jgi:hypothetical protein
MILIFRNINKSNVQETNKPIIQPTPTIISDKLYLKFKKYLKREGVKNSCIDCVYPKLKGKHNIADFERFFKNVRIHNSAPTPFQQDLYKVGDLCGCK